MFSLTNQAARPGVAVVQTLHRAPAAQADLVGAEAGWKRLDAAPIKKAPMRGSGAPEPLPSGERPFLKAGSSPALGTTAKSQATADERKANVRRRSFRLQAYARNVLPKERVAHCMHTPTGSAVAVRLDARGASYRGLQTCGAVWLCPFCSWRISSQRRDELNFALRWARDQGLIPVLLTLTASHSIHDRLRQVVDGMKRAKIRLHQSRDWRAIWDDLAGYVCASELTHGRNGWHFHFHQLMFIRATDEAEALRTVRSCRVAWAAALRKEGLNCNGHGFDVQGAARAGDYVTKWGAAEELSLSGVKEGRVGASEKGRTVWELMAAAADGDTTAGALWVEFARTFKGRRQLVWSKGLKAAAAIAEKADAEMAVDEAQEDGPEAEIGRMDRSEWRSIVRAGLRVELLEAVEAAGASGFQRVLALARRRGKVRRADIGKGIRPASRRPA